jgi:predicted PurR-regulated permease PerM
MDQAPALVQAGTEDNERAKVRKAQEIVERTSASVTQVCLIILTLLAVFYTLFFAAGIILPFVLALVLSMLLSTTMRVMNRRLHIPRVIVALLLIITLFSAVGALAYSGPPTHITGSDPTDAALAAPPVAQFLRQLPATDQAGPLPMLAPANTGEDKWRSRPRTPCEPPSQTKAGR